MAPFRCRYGRRFFVPRREAIELPGAWDGMATDTHYQKIPFSRCFGDHAATALTILRLADNGSFLSMRPCKKYLPAVATKMVTVRAL